MARFLFVWMIMIGAMLGIREGAHFEVDMWPRMAPRPQAALRLVSNLAVLAFAFVFVWSGYDFTRFAWNRISELAELPLWLIHIAWPLTGISWLLFTWEQMWRNLRILLYGDLVKEEEKGMGSAV
jgi:TRAP-type C4-dicarboxylate transport system permease small subunit